MTSSFFSPLLHQDKVSAAKIKTPAAEKRAFPLAAAPLVLYIIELCFEINRRFSAAEGGIFTQGVFDYGDPRLRF